MVEIASRRRIDVRKIRGGMGLTQEQFAEKFDLPLATLRYWEQGRGSPSGAARVLLLVLQRTPAAVIEALDGAPQRRAIVLDRAS